MTLRTLVSAQQETISSEIKWLEGQNEQPQQSENREMCFYVPPFWVKKNFICASIWANRVSDIIANLLPEASQTIEGTFGWTLLVYFKSFSQWCRISCYAPAWHKLTTIRTAITIIRIKRISSWQKQVFKHLEPIQLRVHVHGHSLTLTSLMKWFGDLNLQRSRAKLLLIPLRYANRWSAR